MDETTHELLLRLAGRVDDDLLADARELVAVGEDGHALELVTAALAADATALPPAVRAELVTAAAAARIDLDADAALAPAAPDTTAHRFSAVADGDVPVIAAARELPDRLRDGIRLRLAWRQTPAGPAPTPLPHPVLLVETPEGGRPGEVLAYQVGAAMARSGVHVAVEALTSGRPLTSYHAAALRDSTPITGDAPPRPASSPEKVESVVAEVVEEVAASHRIAPPAVDPAVVDPAVVDPAAADPAAADPAAADPAAADPAAADPAAADPAAADPAAAEERPVDLFAVDDGPAPRPVPIRAWQSGRRRRGFGEQTAESEPEDDLPEADGPGPLPSPVPLARRTRPRQAVTETASAADPLVGPLDQPLMDPLLDPTAAESAWTEEWASGGWAVAGNGGPDANDAAADDQAAASRGGTAAPGAPGPTAGSPGPDAGQPGPAAAQRGSAAVQPASATAPRTPGVPGTGARSPGGPAHALADPPTGPVGAPAAGPPMSEALLKPEAMARLSDADRALLTRLQAELTGNGAPDRYAPGAGPNGRGGPGRNGAGPA